jgi:secondary thiamine-phosphate synthase enzyme
METFTVQTRSRNEMVNIDAEVADALRSLGSQDGIALVFTPHTTAGITINENADPDVQRDLVATLNKLVPEGQGHFRHGEGNSDSHLKSTLVGASEQVLVSGGRPVLGTWQSLYFCEFDGPRRRKVHVGFTAGE